MLYVLGLNSVLGLGEIVIPKLSLRSVVQLEDERKIRSDCFRWAAIQLLLLWLLGFPPGPFRLLLIQLGHLGLPQEG